MTVAEAAEAFGVTSSNIREHIRVSGLVVRIPDDQTLDALKQEGLVPFKTTVVNLLPDTTVEALIKIINTPEAWAAYRTIFGVGKAALKAAQPAEKRQRKQRTHA